MKLIQEFQLLEAESKKYIDKDGKSVRRIVKDKPLKAQEEPTTSKATKRGPVVKLNWQDNQFIKPPVSELFGKCNYDKRIKRIRDDERVDTDIIGDIYRFAHMKNNKMHYIDKDGKPGPAMAEIKVVGTTYKQNPIWETWHKAETLELHFKDGSIVPATRLSSNSVIVQDYRFKAYMPSGAKKFWELLRDTFNR